MTRSCAVCGNSFETKRPQGRFCGATCRKRASRGAGAASPTPPTAALESLPQSGPGVVAAVVNELTAAGRVNTMIGQTAIKLAVRLETSTVDTGSGLAALSRELRAVMGQALAGSKSVDPVDELRARRDRKLSAG